MKLRIPLPTILIALLLCPAAVADLTVRYKIIFKTGTGIPAASVPALQQAMKALPSEMAMRVHVDMARSELMGKTTIIDYGRRQITVLDAQGQRYATAPLDEYTGVLPFATTELPPAVAEALRNMKFDVEAKNTGRIGNVYGIRSEESVIVITVGTAAPAGQPFGVRIEMTLWRPLADEMTRVRELQEYAAFAARAKNSADPMEMVNRIYAALPGLGDQLRAAVQSLAKDTGRPALKMEAALSMPGLATVLEQAGQQGQVPAGLDRSGNMIEMTWELSELSTAPLTGDLFTVPAAFHPVAMKDLLSVPAAVSFKPPTASYGSGQPAPSAPVPMTPTPEGGVLRVGGGVSAPRLTGKVEPAYSPEARSAHVQGTVVLSVVVGSDGVAHELRVTRSLQPDLDQKAIEAVSQWKFQPGMKDGKPVNTMATIEVNFRLLDNPPTQ